MRPVYYLYDPDMNRFEIRIRRRIDNGASRLVSQSHVRGWTSARLGVRFSVTPATLELFDPSGRPFLTSVELARRADAEQARAVHASARAAQESPRAEQQAERAREAEARANRAQARAERLAERLRALGIDPDIGSE
jgi:acyl-CoA reductase-like NAD-dependent aldehyde dehydrogenase